MMDQESIIPKQCRGLLIINIIINYFFHNVVNQNFKVLIPFCWLLELIDTHIQHIKYTVLVIMYNNCRCCCLLSLIFRRKIHRVIPELSTRLWWKVRNTETDPQFLYSDSLTRQIHLWRVTVCWFLAFKCFQTLKM